MSRSFRWTVSQPPSSEDLDLYPATTRPTPHTTPTPSIMKSRISASYESGPASKIRKRPARRPMYHVLHKSRNAFSTERSCNRRIAKCMSAVPVTGRRRLIRNAHIQRSRYTFVTAPEYRFLSTRELQTEELLLLKVELFLGQDAHINEPLQLLQRLNLLVRRHLGSGRFRGLPLWTDGLRHIHAE